MSFEVKRGVLTLESAGRAADTLFAQTGFRPKGLLLWWTEKDELAPRGNRGGIGIHAEGESIAHAWFADDQVATDALTQAVGEFAVVALGSPLPASPACQAEVTLDDLGFALEWQATAEGTWDVHYLAFGGSELREAAITRVELAADRERVTVDVGFRPDFALFIPTAAGGVDPVPELFYGIGVTVGPDRQAATGVAARIEGASAVVRSAQRSDAVVAVPSVSGEKEFRALARMVEFGPSGPILDVAGDPATPPLPVACLALAGGRYSVLTHAGSRRPGRSRTRDVGFPPAAVLAFGWGLAASTQIKQVPRLSVGAADQNGSACVSWTLRPRGLWPLEPRSRSTEGRLLEVADTRSTALHAHARIAAVHMNGFTLEWPESDGPRRQFVYAAFGAAENIRRRQPLMDAVRGLLGAGAGK
jgi:hypothetical protein